MIPATQMNAPATISSFRRFVKRTLPNHAAPAPNATKIAVKPSTNTAVAEATRRG
jgi:hypothetical protein